MIGINISGVFRCEAMSLDTAFVSCVGRNNIYVTLAGQQIRAGLQIRVITSRSRGRSRRSRTTAVSAATFATPLATRIDLGASIGVTSGGTGAWFCAGTFLAAVQIASGALVSSALVHI